MKAVESIKGSMVPLYRPDVDTDQIVPKQFLKRVERTGFGEFLFYNWARKDDGSLDPDFVLNKPEYRDAKILVTGPNFGSGSSREHAVWALQDWGFEAIVAPSFADIFYGNCSKVGVLCAAVKADVAERLAQIAASDPGAEAEIDLSSQTITCGSLRAEFEIDPHVKARLIQGLDDIGMTEAVLPAINEYEAARPTYLPKMDAPVASKASPLRLVVKASKGSSAESDPLGV